MQNQFLIFGGDCDSTLCVTQDCGDVFSHFGYSGPTPYAELDDDDYEKKYPKKIQKFNKVLIEISGIGSIECYLHENDYKYYLEQHLKNQIKENDIQNQQELTDWVNDYILKYSTS